MTVRLDDLGRGRHPIVKGLAASGWQAAALTMKRIVHAGGDLGLGVIGTQGEAPWPRSTRPG